MEALHEVWSVLLITSISGGAGGLASFLYALRLGHYRNNKYVEKCSIEILGAIVTASFLAAPFIPDDKYTLAMAIAFMIGVSWAKFLQLIREKITDKVVDTLGQALKAVPKSVLTMIPKSMTVKVPNRCG